MRGALPGYEALQGLAEEEWWSFTGDRVFLTQQIRISVGVIQLGLSLAVGLEESEEECREIFGPDLAKLNQLLISTGLHEHNEPCSIAEDDIFSCDMIGYSGLHYLRRLALYLEAGLDLPKPGPPIDSELETDAEYVRLQYQYHSRFTRGSSHFVNQPMGIRLRSLLGMPTRKPTEAYLPFSHLIMHGDADGIYIPQNFAAVRYFNRENESFGLSVGSSQKLLEECRRLAKEIGLPLDLDVDGAELLNALEAHMDGSADWSADEGLRDWRRYGIESYGCLALIRGCEASIKLNAALIFC